MIVEMPPVFVLPVMAAIIPVSVMVAVTIAQMISAVMAIMVPVFCKGKSAQDQRQAQKNY
jgi:hypothetical protein